MLYIPDYIKPAENTVSSHFWSSDLPLEEKHFPLLFLSSDGVGYVAQMFLQHLFLLYPLGLFPLGDL